MLWLVEGQIYCTDVSGTAYQFPLVHAPIESSANGPVITVRSLHYQYFSAWFRVLCIACCTFLEPLTGRARAGCGTEQRLHLFSADCLWQSKLAAERGRQHEVGLPV